MTQEVAQERPAFAKLPLLWLRRGLIIGVLITWAGAVTSCVMQVNKQRETTQGMLIIWPGNGWITAVVKIVMFGGVLISLRHITPSPFRWMACLQNTLIVLTSLILLGTNSVLFLNLLLEGVAVGHWTTWASLVMAVLCVAYGLLRMKKMPRNAKLFVFLVGVNFIPTFLQGVAFLLYGMKGMPWQPCAILVGLAYFMYYQALPKGKDFSWKERLISPSRRMELTSNADAAFLALRWELYVTAFSFGICWGIRKLLPLLL